MQNFDMSKINNISNNLSAINMSEVTLPIIDGFAQDLKYSFTEPAKSTGMYKQVSLNPQKKKKQTQIGLGSMMLVRHPKITTSHLKSH